MSVQQATTRAGGANSPEPPPIPNSAPPLNSAPPEHSSVLPGETVFTTGLLRFLIVSFAFVTILLAANVFVVVSRQSPAPLARYSENVPNVQPVAGMASSKEHSKEVPANSPLKVGLEENLAADDSPIVIKEPEPEPFFQASNIQTASDEGANDKSIETEFPNPIDAVSKPILNGLAAVSRIPSAFTSERSSDVDATQKPLILTQTKKAKTQQQPEEESCPSPPVASAKQPAANDATVDITKDTAPYYGTKIEWNRFVKDASTKAKSQNKLVYLIHVSGNFTKEEFT